jgi:predicted RNA-binding protein with PUA-like domain
MTAYWLVKTEPETYSFETLLQTGFTDWDGVRNFQARNNLVAMKKGDWVMVYHSISDKAVVGLAKVSKAAYPDPTDETGKWMATGMVPVCALSRPVTLAEIKANPELVDIALIKQSRLSVMPLEKAHFEKVLAMSGTTLPAGVN